MPLIDTTNRVETPEGITLALHAAGAAPRAYAWLIDALIRYSFIFLAFLALGQLGKFGMGIVLILFFITEWFYPVLFEVLRSGQTPGKRSMGLRVIHDDGTPIGWSRSILRNLLMAADFLPAAYGLGLLSMLFHGQFKRLGDLAAGTLVVYTEPKHTGTRIAPGLAIAPQRSLSAAEQRLVVSWAERSAMLSQPRTQELAAILGPLTHTQGPSAVQQLLNNARWSAGMDSEHIATQYNPYTPQQPNPPANPPANPAA